MIKDKLQIFLPANDKTALLRTLEQFFDKSSPFRDCAFTVLTDPFDDGRDEILANYQKTFSNINVIKHKTKIGQNANICRAYECVGSCKKEYSLVLFENNIYDFSNTDEVKEGIYNLKDIIFLSNCAFSSTKEQSDPVYRMLQSCFNLSFIFRSRLVNDYVLTDMYNADTKLKQPFIYDFAQKTDAMVQIPLKSVVYNEANFNFSEKRDVILQVLSALGYLSDEKLKKSCIEAVIKYNDDGKNEKRFYEILLSFFNSKNFDLFYKIYKNLMLKRKISFWLYLFKKRTVVLLAVENIFDTIKILIMQKLHNIFTRL